MNEKDAIKDLFSNAFEQHSAPVRPEVWKGLQAKMAAAGVAGTSAVAVKGISALAKWIIGGAAVVTTATVTTLLLTTEKPQNSVNNQQVVAKQAAPDAAEDQQPEVSTPDSHRPAKNEAPAGRVTNSVPADQDPGMIFPPNVFENSQPVGKQTDKPQEVIQKTETATQKQDDPATGSQNPAVSDQQDNAGTTGAIQPVAKITRVPNVLTPNHDGDNDEFFIESENITDFSVVFLNSAGVQVYKSADPAFRWDGTDLNGDAVPNGQYRCIIIASGPDKKPIKRLEMVVVAR